MTETVATEATTSQELPSTAQVADKTAMDFKIMLPLFKRHIAVLSNKAKDRVINAVLEYPLYDREPIFQSAKEKDLFDIGLRLIDAKTVMIQAVYEERLKNEIAEAAANTKEKEQETNV